MNKKFLGILAALVLGTTSVFATGVGIQGSLNVGNNLVGGGAITFKLNKSPYVFAVHVDSTPYVGVTFDDWIANPTISGNWKWFYGVGGAVGAGFPGESVFIDVGGRLIVGTNVFLAKQFELYAQVAWQPHVWFNINGSGTWGDFNLFCFPADIGLRFWF